MYYMCQPLKEALYQSIVYRISIIQQCSTKTKTKTAHPYIIRIKTKYAQLPQTITKYTNYGLRRRNSLFKTMTPFVILYLKYMTIWTYGTKD